MLAKLIVTGATAPSGRGQAAEPRWPPRAWPASRPTCATCARWLRRPGVRAGPHDHALPGRAALPAAGAGGAGARRADHRAGLARPPRLLGRRRAALRPDGRPGACAWPTAWSATREDAAALECTLSGPTLRFHARHRDRRRAARPWPVTLDGVPLPLWQSHHGAGRQRAAARRGAGRRRAHLPGACAAGSTCRAYLGSRATFTLGQFGGHGGPHAARRRRAARRRPMPSQRRWHALPPDAGAGATSTTGTSACSTARTARRTSSPPDDIGTFFGTDWQVHYNSSRTGVRLIGPKPAVGAARRRRGRPAPVQHPRQRLCHRRDRLHRRHAGHPRPRRPQPGRLRLPGRGAGRRALEAGPAAPRRHAALPLRHAPTQALALHAAQESRIADLAWPPPDVPQRTEAVGSPILAPARGQRRAPGAGAAARPATATCWSSTGPTRCSTSRCACACTRLMQSLQAQRCPASST